MGKLQFLIFIFAVLLPSLCNVLLLLPVFRGTCVSAGHNRQPQMNPSMCRLGYGLEKGKVVSGGGLGAP